MAKAAHNCRADGSHADNPNSGRDSICHGGPRLFATLVWLLAADEELGIYVGKKLRRMPLSRAGALHDICADMQS